MLKAKTSTLKRFEKLAELEAHTIELWRESWNNLFTHRFEVLSDKSIQRLAVWADKTKSELTKEEDAELAASCLKVFPESFTPEHYGSLKDWAELVAEIHFKSAAFYPELEPRLDITPQSAPSPPFVIQHLLDINTLITNLSNAIAEAESPAVSFALYTIFYQVSLIEKIAERNNLVKPELVFTEALGYQ